MLAFYACKEERNLPVQQPPQDHYVQVSSTDGALIQKQLSWIAKGLAGIADQSSTTKTRIHDLVEITDFYAESNENLDDDLQTAFGYDYDNEVDQWLQNNQPGNDYDQDFFFDIDIDNCPGKVGILIPEADIIDQNKLHVVTISNPLDEAIITLGYYINSIGIIDSLPITDGNMDSVYLWIVGVVANCDDDSAICGNGILEKGETCESCPQDCPTTLHVTVPNFPTYKLILKEVKLWTDHKNGSGGHPNDQYQEDHLQGKYQINLGFATYNNNGSGTVNHSRIDELMFGASVNSSMKIEKYKAWGRKAKIKRCDISKSKCNRGSHTIDVVERLMVDDFQPDVENFIFTLFEKDRFSVPTNRNDPNIWSNSWAYSYSPGQNNNVQANGRPTGTFSDAWAIMECSGIGPGTNRTPGPPFVQVGSHWECVLALDGEADVVFKLVKN
jgi:hypothetical protein